MKFRSEWTICLVKTCMLLWFMRYARPFYTCFHLSVYAVSCDFDVSCTAHQKQKNLVVTSYGQKSDFDHHLVMNIVMVHMTDLPTASIISIASKKSNSMMSSATCFDKIEIV